MWLAGQSKIIPGDTLVGICGNKLTDKGQAAYDLCHCTVGKSEVRYKETIRLETQRQKSPSLIEMSSVSDSPF